MPDPVPMSPKLQLTTASRLVSGGLSFLLVLAMALASGVPTGQLLATVTSCAADAGLERAVVPQPVERRSVKRQQERPATEPTLASQGRCSGSGDPSRNPTVGAVRPSLLRQALLSLPPPSAC